MVIGVTRGTVMVSSGFPRVRGKSEGNLVLLTMLTDTVSHIDVFLVEIRLYCMAVFQTLVRHVVKVASSVRTACASMQHGIVTEMPTAVTSRMKRTAVNSCYLFVCISF